MGVTEEQRFLFQTLPYEENHITAHVIILRDTDYLGLLAEPSERCIIKMYIIKIFS